MVLVVASGCLEHLSVVTGDEVHWTRIATLHECDEIRRAWEQAI